MGTDESGRLAAVKRHRGGLIDPKIAFTQLTPAISSRNTIPLASMRFSAECDATLDPLDRLLPYSSCYQLVSFKYDSDLDLIRGSKECLTR
jgi:hypothetical protein